MSFLSVAFLSALPLIAAPFLLHWFDRRRNVPIQWAAMQFVMAASSRKSSARRLKQWLLLLLRALAIAALIFALARPMISGGWMRQSGRTETLLILDNSMSMSRSMGETTMIRQAAGRAIAEVQRLDPGDRIRIMTASPYPVWVDSASVRVDDRSRDSLIESINSIPTTLGRSDLLSALFTAVQSDPHATVQSRRIVVVSDRQSGDWQNQDRAGWKRLGSVLSESPIRTELDFVNLDSADDLGMLDSFENMAIDRVQSNRTVVGVDEPVTLSALVHNYGRVTSSGAAIDWQVDSKNVFDDQIDGVDAGEIQQANWKYSFATVGAYRVTATVNGDDGLRADNVASIVIEVVDEVPVLIIDSSLELAEIQQDSYFASAALGWIAGVPLDSKSVYIPEIVSPEQIASMQLARFRVVVIPNLVSLDDDAMGAIREFVREGGGLWVGLGPRTDVDSFSENWFTSGNGLSPLPLEGIIDEVNFDETSGDAQTSNPTTTPQPRSRINPFAAEHAATAHVADNEQLDIADVVVDRRFQFRSDDVQTPTSTLLSLSNGQPLAIEKQFGKGRVVVQAIPMRMQWSSLVRSQAFVVMVRDWIDYLGQPKSTRFNLLPGDPIELRLSGGETRSAVLSTPGGESVELAADGFSDETLFRTNRTSLPGDYSLELGLAGDRVPFHVDREPSESDLTPLTTQEMEHLASFQLSTAEQAAAKGGGGVILNQATGTSGQRDPLWPGVLMLLAAVITAELMLSGLLSRERFGSVAAVASTDVHASMGPHLGASPSIGSTITGSGKQFAGISVGSASPGRSDPVDSVSQSVEVRK